MKKKTSERLKSSRREFSHSEEPPRTDPVSDLLLLENQIFAIAYLLEVADADAPPDQTELNGIGLIVRGQAEALQTVRRFFEDQEIERSKSERNR